MPNVQRKIKKRRRKGKKKRIDYTGLHAYQGRRGEERQEKKTKEKN